MRLGQLARKLSMRPADIVSFLANQQVNIDSGTNARLHDDHVLLVVRQFAPAMESIIREEITQEITTDVEPEEASADNSYTDTWDDVPAETFQATDSALPASVQQETDANETPSIPTEEAPAAEGEPVFDPFEGVDVIRAPKVELPGLKVLGKIDLPEPKKKEQSAEGEAAARTDARNRREGRTRREERPRRNPIALQREREAREEARKREEEMNQKKAKRKQNYIRKVQVKPAAQKTEKVRAARPERTPSKNAQPATSWWGRFTGWLFRK